MPEDDRIEPIPEMLDLNDLFEEVLALNLPLYPRVAEADNIVARVTEPGKSAMTDDDVKPFANLATLRDKLTKDGN